jgi:hypothetical protein
MAVSNVASSGINSQKETLTLKDELEMKNHAAGFEGVQE